ncbi:MAG TPA: C25 family cysteine peptidase [Thermoanaerobaculia bacterium]|nr:C25 family cysteine peptidase [Thermoanaerobaculia bacterium]
MKTFKFAFTLLTIAAPVAAIVGPPPNQIPLPGLGVTGSIVEPPAGCGVLRPATLAAATAQQFKKQSELAADFGLKIYVTQEGWYRVTREQMSAAGFNPGANFKKLSLFEAGIEQPLVVNADSIEFYGRGLDTISTGARTYWLRWSEGSANRLPLVKSRGGAALTGSVAFAYQKRERSMFLAAIVNNGDAENYFGPLVWSEPTGQPLRLGNADAGAAGNATLEVTLQGGTDGPHRTAIAFNGQSLGVVTYDNQEQKTFTFAVPHASLAAANSVAFTALGGDNDFSVVASTKLAYQHLLRADSGEFEASLPAGRSVRVGGFTSNAIRAIDVTDAPVELETAIASDPLGGYAATFTPSGSGNRVVLVFDDSRILAPAELAANRPSTWSDGKGSADLLIISNSAFMQAASGLVPVRKRDGINAAAIDVEDLYDEFNFGVRGPEAIRAFLKSTLQWKTRPRWVLLVGDASIDPRNYLGLGAYDFMPTKLIPTVYLKTACDDWIADVDGDGVPDFAIGRIPARTAQDAELMFNKITSRGTPSGAWANSVLSIADRPEGYDFAAAADAATSFVPHTMTLQKIEFAQSTAGVPAALNQGQLLVDYVGHGTVDLWGLDGVFNTGDAVGLTNGNRLPFVVAMNCLNGYFHDLFSYSMAEGLLEAPNGGAVAVWASTTLTEPDGQAVMNRELLSRVFGNVTIGEAINQAKRAVEDKDTRNSWILFGDPSLKLKP